MYLLKVRLDRNPGKFHDKVNRLMDEVMNLRGPVLNATSADWVPEADLYETAEEIVLLVNLAGVRKEDIEVTFFENYLRVAGTRALCGSDSPARYHRLEMGHGSFERVFRVPAWVDGDRIEAAFSEGLLTVRMKKGPMPQPRFIELDQ